MNGRQKHLMGVSGADPLQGQRWIRKVRATKINNPLNIEIIEEPEGGENRYYVRNCKNNEYFFFEREDISGNYDRKEYVGDITLNQQICEIKGWRWVRQGNDVWRLFLNGNTIPPNYDKSPRLSSELLESLVSFEPKIKVKIGKYTVYLDKSYTGDTREIAICKAWVDKNE